MFGSREVVSDVLWLRRFRLLGHGVIGSRTRRWDLIIGLRVRVGIVGTFLATKYKVLQPPIVALVGSNLHGSNKASLDVCPADCQGGLASGDRADRKGIRGLIGLIEIVDDGVLDGANALLQHGLNSRHPHLREKSLVVFKLDQSMALKRIKIRLTPCATPAASVLSRSIGPSPGCLTHTE